MKRFLHRRFFVVTVSLLVIVVAVAWYFTQRTAEDHRATVIVESGIVRQTVAVSAALKAENTAELAFPTSGTITGVFVRKGDVVATGTRLVTLDAAALQAEVLDAEASLAAARADRAALLAGVRSETRAVSGEAITLKEEALALTIAQEAQKVQNAYRTLLSSGLAAYTNKTTESATPPTISGTYTCNNSGSYTLTFYRSSSASGYSVRVTGLETGVYSVSSDQSLPFGSCGLKVSITAGENYHNSIWTVPVPNTSASVYTTNKNTYELALTSRDSAIELAQRELALAQAQGAETTAPARNEDLAQKDALVAQAMARLARARAIAKDSALIAPFAGTVVSVDAVAGEAVSSVPIITLLSADRYELIARVPEIDVGKLRLDQTATVMFDTAPQETLTARIDFISPSATVIDGVSYYEARLALTSTPDWLRSGLNADVDIIIAEQSGLRIPRRFLSTTQDGYTVTRAHADDTSSSQPVTVTLIGNDGYALVEGVSAGDTLIAP